MTDIKEGDEFTDLRTGRVAVVDYFNTGWVAYRIMDGKFVHSRGRMTREEFKRVTRHAKKMER